LRGDEGRIRAIAYQAAAYDEAPAKIDSGKGVSRCQRHELVAPAEQERGGLHEERVSMQLLEGGVDLGFGGGSQDDELYIFRARRFLYGSDDLPGSFNFRAR